jgi:hypothetical protein
MSRSESELLFAIAFFDRGLPGTFGEARGNIPAKLPDAAYGPEGEADGPTIVAGPHGRASVAD